MGQIMTRAEWGITWTPFVHLFPAQDDGAGVLGAGLSMRLPVNSAEELGEVTGTFVEGVSGGR